MRRISGTAKTFGTMLFQPRARGLFILNTLSLPFRFPLSPLFELPLPEAMLIFKGTDGVDGVGCGAATFGGGARTGSRGIGADDFSVCDALTGSTTGAVDSDGGSLAFSTGKKINVPLLPPPFPAFALPLANTEFIDVGALLSMSMTTRPPLLPTVFDIELIPFVVPIIVIPLFSGTSKAGGVGTGAGARLGAGTCGVGGDGGGDSGGDGGSGCCGGAAKPDDMNEHLFSLDFIVHMEVANRDKA